MKYVFGTVSALGVYAAVKAAFLNDIVANYDHISSVLAAAGH